MEQKLKEQRRRLVLRITLVLLAVWLTVSAMFCVIVVYNEKSDIQNSAMSDLSRARQRLSVSELGTETSSRVYISSFDLLYFKNTTKSDFDTQFLVIDPDSGEVIADTAGKIEAEYCIRTDVGAYPDVFGYLDYGTVRGSLSDAQFESIRRWLQTADAGGGSYELVCSRFYFHESEIVPLELSVVLARSPSQRFDSADIAEVMALPHKAPEGTAVYYNSYERLNIIPKDFILNGAFNRDYIGQLTEEQRQESMSVIPVGAGDYIFYYSEYYYLDAYVYNKAVGAFENNSKLYLVQYAIKSNIVKNCMNDLVTGICVIFVFFFLIGVILCTMIWKIVRMQIIQEQKRRDFTNALAHDIKTPLFVISGYAYSLRENIDENERDSYLDKIIAQTEQINSLVHKMLNLSKLDSYAMTLNRTEFDLFELTEEILEDFTVLPEGKSIEVSHSGSSLVNADRELIRTVLQNLTDNAVKYSLPQSQIRISITDRSLSVSNPCEPLSRAELRQIWQPYYRKDKSRHKKGNGLGLSIVKSILDLHGVKYEVNMKDGCMVFRAEF